MRGHRDLELTAAAAIVCTLVALVAPLGAIRVLATLPLALLIPGFALTAALFARRSLDWQRTLALSLGLSLSVLALGSLLLNYVPGGIRAASWAVLLLLVILNGCRSAALRRAGRPSERAGWRLRPSPIGVVLSLAGLGLAGAAIALASAPHPAPKAIGYTQLWLLPVAGSHGSEARVGVRSEEQHPLAYDLRVRVGSNVKARPSFVLKPGKHRTVRVRAEPGAGSRVPVVATLLLQHHPYHVYRRVHGWLSEPEAR